MSCLILVPHLVFVQSLQYRTPNSQMTFFCGALRAQF